MNQFSQSLPELSPLQAQRLTERIGQIPLYAHAYSFHLNFRYNRTDISKLLKFAYQQRLDGIKIHLDDGEALSLRYCNEAGLSALREEARQLGQEIHLEVSSTELSELSQAVRIGQALEATSIRCYPRYSGRISEIINWTVRDLCQLQLLDPEGQFRFTVEQHEDLKGAELASIVEAVDNPNLKLLFDFANMLNAYEQPLEALQAMMPHISDVHIKDALLHSENGGWGHRACRSGKGEIPMARLLLELLLLGDDQPQVVAYGLEEEVEYFAPPLRFPDEADDPFIPPREVSETDVPEGSDIEAMLVQECQYAQQQLNHVRGLLAQLRQHAQLYL